jgi:hypothetical protein
MRNLAGWFMAGNATIFFFGAVQHAGVAIGPFHEPKIVAAAIVETVCGVSLLWGAVALFRNWKRSWGTAVIANSIAWGGVLLGMAALAVGAGPRTASNDLYHRMMLILIAAATLILFFQRIGVDTGPKK